MSQRPPRRRHALHERFALVALRALEWVRGTLPSRPLRRIGLVGALTLLVAASPAHAINGQKILELCGQGKPFGGFSQKAYHEALKLMEAGQIEYSACEQEIGEAARRAARASGGLGASEGAAGPAGLTNTPIPLTPAESRAVESAHHHGAAAVAVGNTPVRPGVVHADIASAVNKLPRPLLALLALLIASALIPLALEARKRVNARRDG